MSEQKEVIKEIETLKKEFQENGKAVFSKYTQSLFAAVPELESITWDQYTPSFNDGDVCEFTIGEVGYNFSTDINAEEEDECHDCEEVCEGCEEDEDDDYEDSDEERITEYEVRESNLSSKAKKAIKDFDDGFNAFSCVLEQVFDTNQTITIKRNGKATVEDYDCGY